LTKILNVIYMLLLVYGRLWFVHVISLTIS